MKIKQMDDTNYKTEKINLKYWLIIFMISMSSVLVYTKLDHQKKVNQLEKQLQHEQMKYKIIINDPLVRDAMEAGG